MLEGLSVPYRVFLPIWVFRNANSKEEISENARRYIKIAYPDKEFIRIEGQFAVCKSII